MVPLAVEMGLLWVFDEIHLIEPSTDTRRSEADDRLRVRP